MEHSRNSYEHSDIENMPSALAIQCLPMGITEKDRVYEIVDSVIQEIIASGLSYQVGPFETVIEGPLGEILPLIGRLHRRLLESGIDTGASYIKLWSGRNLGSSAEKTEKYTKPH
ncbi:MAG: thiamine-binding protein [Breznakiellaceae bacterium]